jgi:hypothetical protein
LERSASAQENMQQRRRAAKGRVSVGARYRGQRRGSVRGAPSAGSYRTVRWRAGPLTEGPGGGCGPSTPYKRGHLPGTCVVRSELFAQSALLGATDPNSRIARTAMRPRASADRPRLRPRAAPQSAEVAWAVG